MMNHEAILKSKKTILFAEKRRMTRIVIGSPHHAPGGVENLPCKEHPDADENSGIIARRVAEKLRASSIIACNYHIDANKNLGTDYSLQIAKWKPKYLIEIHGHSGKKTGNHRHRKTGEKAKTRIEISSGSESRNELSKKFASVLQKKLEQNPELKTLTVYGDFNEIRFTASKTATITSGNWKALHIELPPMLRKNGKKLPKIANGFINILEETIAEVCK
ncbi:MAG: hypothetical protein H8D45_27150 [Bacteroidetes bacterium]|nr:hypothetical protein [Bacteroidota bacterium]MBL7105818.1 hypothetical protein [Bacteroidales bacterium]